MQLAPLICHLETWLTGNVSAEGPDLCFLQLHQSLHWSPAGRGQTYPLTSTLRDLLDSFSGSCTLQEGCMCPSSAAGSSDPLARRAVQKLKCIYRGMPCPVVTVCLSFEGFNSPRCRLMLLFCDWPDVHAWSESRCCCMLLGLFSYRRGTVKSLTLGQAKRF